GFQMFDNHGKHRDFLRRMFRRFLCLGCISSKGNNGHRSPPKTRTGLRTCKRLTSRAIMPRTSKRALSSAGAARRKDLPKQPASTHWESLANSGPSPAFGSPPSVVRGALSVICCGTLDSGPAGFLLTPEIAPPPRKVAWRALCKQWRRFLIALRAESIVL